MKRVSTDPKVKEAPEKAEVYLSTILFSYKTLNGCNGFTVIIKEKHL